MTNLPEMIPLSDADLDAVAGGHVNASGGLVNVDVDVNNNTVTLRDFANNNHINIGAAIAVLGGVAAILQRA
jgi:hypothetical protein